MKTAMIEDFEDLASAAKDILEQSEQPCNDFYRDSSVTTTTEFCDIDELETRASWAVENFISRDDTREIPYRDADISLRAEYMQDFYANFSQFSGYSGNLSFSDTMAPNELGAFNPETKEIVLNSDLLSADNPKEAMTTIMHESRHAYQDFAVNHPDKVSVDAETIATWKYNMEHYISPCFDFEAYVNQPIEADADIFAEKMYEQGAAYAA